MVITINNLAYEAKRVERKGKPFEVTKIIKGWETQHRGDSVFSEFEGWLYSVKFTEPQRSVVFK